MTRQDILGPLEGTEHYDSVKKMFDAYEGQVEYIASQINDMKSSLSPYDNLLRLRIIAIESVIYNAKKSLK